MIRVKSVFAFSVATAVLFATFFTVLALAFSVSFSAALQLTDSGVSPRPVASVSTWVIFPSADAIESLSIFVRRSKQDVDASASSLACLLPARIAAIFSSAFFNSVTAASPASASALALASISLISLSSSSAFS